MALHLDALLVQRGTFRLGPVDLEVAAGVTALVGPNGAGKTTLMSAVLGLVPAAGKVAVDGHAVWGRDRAAAMRLLGYLPQRPHIPPILRVQQAVSYAAWLKQVEPACRDAAVARSLAAVDLTELSARRVGRLSGGQQQRAAIAQAIVHDPSFLLLDEPSVGLDPEQRSHLYKVIRQIAADGAAVMVSTHNMDDVSAVADRVIILRQGQVVADHETLPADPSARFEAINQIVAKSLGYAR